jgi:deoxyribodipyrimidine photolyase-related protein
MILLLGNMLFPHHSVLPLQRMPVVMIEDAGFCTRFQFHKHKLILVLAAMRHHCDTLRQQGVTVDYWRLEDEDETAPLSYEAKLLRAVQRHHTTELHTYTIDDHDLNARLQHFCTAHQLQLICYESPLFLTSLTEFQAYRQRHKRLFMGDFYKFQRRRLNLLLDDQGEPLGGQWSYDDQNRKPLPKKIAVPPLTLPTPTPHVQAVGYLVDRYFAEHPGRSQDFWLPVTLADAQTWLHQFLTERFAHFGPYEDALSTRTPFVFHSVLSPLLNIGLLTPQAVLDAVLDYNTQTSVPLNSLEGFVRQIVGWREYIRGVYHTLPTQRQQNTLQHNRTLTSDWYRSTTGLVPVDQVIQRVQERGWAHHIERLMVISNAMLLAQVHPDEVFRWFMAFFVDSADWVMVPNIYGMGQFADGGQMMTKPYISGSNYLRKMGDYPQGDWCEVWDGLYWRFIDHHRERLSRNPRLSMMVKTLAKIDPQRRQQIFAKATDFIHAKTIGNAVI